MTSEVSPLEVTNIFGMSQRDLPPIIADGREGSDRCRCTLPCQLLTRGMTRCCASCVSQEHFSYLSRRGVALGCNGSDTFAPQFRHWVSPTPAGRVSGSSHRGLCPRHPECAPHTQRPQRAPKYCLVGNLGSKFFDRELILSTQKDVQGHQPKSIQSPR